VAGGATGCSAAAGLREVHPARRAVGAHEQPRQGRAVRAHLRLRLRELLQRALPPLRADGRVVHPQSVGAAAPG